MIPEKGGSAEILERLMSSYGVHTQKDLAAALDIAANNISGWTQRDSVPGNAIIKCALDTGVDLQWLVTGELANASHGAVDRQLSGKPLYDEVMRNGGKLVLQRILNAYGFTMQKQLCELLGISSGTVSTWVRRDYFPGDVVVACALDTGVSLKWLATGKGNMFEANQVKDNKTVLIPKLKLEGGALIQNGSWLIDSTIFKFENSDMVLIESVSFSWLVNKEIKSVGNGRWIVSVDNFYDVFDLIRLPGGRIKLSNEQGVIECHFEEVSIFGMALLTTERHV